MKISRTFVCELNQKEALAIKRLIGKTSPATRASFGLTDKQSDICSKIYEELDSELE